MSACEGGGKETVCVKCMCVCGEQGSGPCRPRPPPVNWKRRLLSQRQGSNQRPVSEAKGTLLKQNHRRPKSSVCADHLKECVCVYVVKDT